MLTFRSRLPVEAGKLHLLYPCLASSLPPERMFLTSFSFGSPLGTSALGSSSCSSSGIQLHMPTVCSLLALSSQASGWILQLASTVGLARRLSGPGKMQPFLALKGFGKLGFGGYNRNDLLPACVGEIHSPQPHGNCPQLCLLGHLTWKGSLVPCCFLALVSNWPWGIARGTGED